MPVKYVTPMEQEVQRSQAMAELLAKSATSPLQVPQGARMPGWAPLAQGLMGALAGFAGQQAQGQQAAMLQQQQAADNAQLQALLRARMPETTHFDFGPEGLDDVLGPTTLTRGGADSQQYKDALLQAYLNPRFTKLAEEELKNFNSRQISPEKLASRADFGSILQSPSDVSKWRAKDNSMVVGERIFNMPEGQRPEDVGGISYADPFRGPEGQLLQNQTGTGKISAVDTSTKINMNPTLINKAQNEGLAEGYKTMGQQVDRLGQAAANAHETLQSLNNLREMEAQGIFSNVTSGPQTWLTNLGQALGIQVDPTKLGSTEGYNAEINKLWVTAVSEAGGARGLTEKETAEVKKMLPMASTSPEARALIQQYMEKAAQRKIANYQRAVEAQARAYETQNPADFFRGMKDVYTPPAAPAMKPVGAAAAKPTTGRMWNPATKRFE